MSGGSAAPGRVVYPCRGDDSPVPALRVRQSWAGAPVIAFGGQVCPRHAGVVHLLRRMAALLAPLGGHLDLYTKTSVDTLAAAGLKSPTVRVVGFFPAAEMAERVAATAHALFLPASFRPEERLDTSTLFPSKLADYTAIGMPILAWAPSYSSVGRWAAQNPDAVVLLTGENPAPVRSAVLSLAGDRGYAIRLAAAAVAAGSRYFDLGVASSVLCSSLSEQFSGQ